MLKIFKKIKKLFSRNTELDCIIEPIGDDYPITGKHIVYKVPVDGLSRKEAEKKISELMKEYNEEIDWDENTDDMNLPFNKDYWIPTKKQYNV